MNNVISNLNTTGVISICRKLYDDNLAKLSDALYEGGIRLMEVTFDQSDPDCIEKTTKAIKMLIVRHDDMSIGAGTVLTADQVKAAHDAGCQFIVSPNTNVNVISSTKASGMTSIPGAMTPTEILAAWDAGADIVKLFPAGYLGLDYLKDIKAPISHIPLIATAGITLDNFKDYLVGGCCGAGISSYLSDKKIIESGNFDEFTARAKAFIKVFNETIGTSRA